MKTVRPISCLGLLAALLTASALVPAQINPGDLVICHFDFTNGGQGGRIYHLDPVTGQATTLQKRLPAPRNLWIPRWVEMGPLNRSIWVTYTGPQQTGGELHVLDQTGKVTSITPLFGGIKAFRFTDNNDILMVHKDSLLNAGVQSMAVASTLYSGFPAGGPTTNSEIEDTGNWCVSHWGGVYVVDLKNKAIVKNIAGASHVWGGDYHKGDGYYYAGERGTSTNPSAMAGSLYRYDLHKGTYTTVIDGNTSLGKAAYRLMWVDYENTDHTLWLGGRNRAHKFDLRTRSLVKTWAYEASNTLQYCFACATPYGSRPLQLDTRALTGPRRGVTVSLSFPHSKAPGASYLLSASLALRPGLQLPYGQFLDLHPDALFSAVLSGALGQIFQNFQGVLDPAGQALARILVPNDPALKNLRVFVGGVAVVGGQIIPTNCEGFTIP